MQLACPSAFQSILGIMVLGGMWIRHRICPPCSSVVFCLEKNIFTFGRVFVAPQVNISLLGGCGGFCNNNASHGQIIGSSEVMFGYTLGRGLYCFLPVKRLRVVTSLQDTLDDFEK